MSSSRRNKRIFSQVVHFWEVPQMSHILPQKYFPAYILLINNVRRWPNLNFLRNQTTDPYALGKEENFLSIIHVPKPVFPRRPCKGESCLGQELLTRSHSSPVLTRKLRPLKSRPLSLFPLLPQQRNALEECYDKVYFEVFLSSLFLTDDSNILFQQ